jgi:thioredoxin 1
MSKFSDIINQDKAVLIDFFAEWCGPCKMMSPILKDVKDTLGDSITIIKIDVDKNQALASKYQVKGVPTLMLFKAGKQLWRQSGLLQKNEIIKTVEELTK